MPDGSRGRCSTDSISRRSVARARVHGVGHDGAAVRDEGGASCLNRIRRVAFTRVPATRASSRVCIGRRCRGSSLCRPTRPRGGCRCVGGSRYPWRTLVSRGDIAALAGIPASSPTSPLVAIAAEFSPRYEQHRPDLVSIDVRGLSRLLGTPRNHRRRNCGARRRLAACASTWRLRRRAWRRWCCRSRVRGLTVVRRGGVGRRARADFPQRARAAARRSAAGQRQRNAGASARGRSAAWPLPR